MEKLCICQWIFFEIFSERTEIRFIFAASFSEPFQFSLYFLVNCRRRRRSIEAKEKKTKLPIGIFSLTEV